MNNLGYISVDKLIEFANNHINKTIDANDIARFPRADVEEVRHGEWILCACKRYEIFINLFSKPNLKPITVNIISHFYSSFPSIFAPQ